MLILGKLGINIPEPPFPIAINYLPITSHYSQPLHPPQHRVGEVGKEEKKKEEGKIVYGYGK